jgi:hypothetical protein
MSPRNYSKVPKLHSVLVIGDDAILCAQVCASINKKRGYLTVLDGPRMQRPDSDHEIVRRNNVAAKLLPEYIILIGLSDLANQELANRFNSIPTYTISSFEDFSRLPIFRAKPEKNRIVCNPNNLGRGLLQALKTSSELHFEDFPNEDIFTVQECEHLVVCEDDEPLAQVIAANYAFSIGADLRIIPAFPKKNARSILERLYGIYEKRDSSVTEELAVLRRKIRDNVDIDGIEKYSFVTFLTKEIPYGFSFSELPTTHLFTYPDLGIAVFNGFFEEQKGKNGIRVAVLIDSGEVEANEMPPVISSLKSRAVFIRVAQSSGATVAHVSNLIELYPYDLLLVSSHCGDDSGWRFTYEYIDSENIPRRLVVDVAVSISGVEIDGKYEVLQYMRYVSLDGVDWDNEEEKEKLYVGTAIHDFTKRHEADSDFLPVEREVLKRVFDSSALKMNDGSYLVALGSMACNKSPIVFNNACCSWHNLAGRFTFAGARAYIGALIDVSDAEAQAVATEIFGAQFGKPLGVALWQAQNRVYGREDRHPYILVGPHFQRLRTTRDHTPGYILDELHNSAADMKGSLAEIQALGRTSEQALKRRLNFLQSEIEEIMVRYF